jgi:hypothetical protein
LLLARQLFQKKRQANHISPGAKCANKYVICEKAENANPEMIPISNSTFYRCSNEVSVDAEN